MAQERALLNLFDKLSSLIEIPAASIPIPIPDDEKGMKCEICGKVRLQLLAGTVFETNGKKVWTCSFGHFHIYREGQRARGELKEEEEEEEEKESQK
jgi:hypothetical protein